MSCNCNAYGLRARAKAAQTARLLANKALGDQARSFAAHVVSVDRRIEVMGTWDFKWPLGTKIRVAFQPPRNAKAEAFQEAKSLVAAIANRWLDGRADVAFDWLELSEALEAADTPDDETPEARRDRSTFVLPATTQEFLARDYDILVSLDPLLALNEPLLFPKSELGAFARRVDYGVPTVFLGPLKEQSLTEYLKTDLAQYFVLHEFGHVLGLVHEHQNPNLKRLRGKLPPPDVNQDPAEHLIEPIARAFEDVHNVKDVDVYKSGLDVKQFIEDQILAPWPGNPEFSDFREYPEDDAVAFDSVMMLQIFCSLILQGDRRRVPSEPSKGDLDQLAAMYPHQPNANERKPAKVLELNL